MSERISVILADDHSLIRESVKARLDAEPDINVVSTVSNADEAATESIRLHPKVLLMDIDMPGLGAFEAAKIVKSRSPQTRVIFLSGFFHDRYIEEALEAGASGYLTKGESPEAVIQGVRTVASGGTCFSADVQARIVVDSKGLRLAAHAQTRTSTLTRREMEVLRYLARGMSKKQVAQTMHLSVKTVERHSDRLMNKLDIHDRVELARFAIREGLAEP
jgi:DNA-binding NarL/FixJ family response regulator